MLVGANIGDIYVYSKNENIFTHDYSLTASSTSIFVADITGDGTMLLEVDHNKDIRVYKNVDGHLNLFQTLNPSDNSTSPKAGAITDDHQWIVFGT